MGTDEYFVHGFAFLLWEGIGSLPKQSLLLISAVLAHEAGGRRGSSQLGKPGLLLFHPEGWCGVYMGSVLAHCRGPSPPAAPLSPAGDGGSSPQLSASTGNSWLD